MVRLATACLLFVVISLANANAQENLTNLNPLRLEFSLSKNSANAKQADNEISTKSSDRFGTLTYYFKKQFFGEIGYGRPRTHNISINGQTLLRPGNEKKTLSLYGLGFRSYRKASHGEYLGIAIRFTSDLSNKSGSESTQIIRLFTQKDTRTRYAVIQLSRANGNAGEISKLGGRHVWFNTNGVGFGLQWALGIGREVDEAGLETHYRSREVGIIVMYRPTLMDNGYVEAPLDDSLESPFDDSADVDYIDASGDPSCDTSEDSNCESNENPFAEPDGSPFAESSEGSPAESDENPFVKPTEDPSAEFDGNPFAESSDDLATDSDENPFAESDENPFCDPINDPFCESAEEPVVE
jgi:hypothetical protein